MPSKRVLHVGRGNPYMTWCGRITPGYRGTAVCHSMNVLGQILRLICSVNEVEIRRHGPPNLSADPRVCKRCVKAMDRAYKEAQQ